MNGTVVWLILFVVAVLVGPFATLRLIAHLRATRADRAAIRRIADQKQPYDDPDDD